MGCQKHPIFVLMSYHLIMKRLEEISEKLTSYIGTPLSIVIHTFLFVGIFSLKFVGFDMDKILLVLTTAVSLEAIYLSIFIQMSVNRTKESLASVEKDIDEIQEDVDDIQEDVEDLNEEDEEDEATENEVIKKIKDIEERLVLLHRELTKINNKK
jgi:low affinity Fe/Cu permease